MTVIKEKSFVPLSFPKIPFGSELALEPESSHHVAMISVLRALALFFGGLFKSRRRLEAENLISASRGVGCDSTTKSAPIPAYSVLR